MYYVGICLYTRSFIEDLSAIIELQNKTIEQRISIKEKLVQFVQLHEDLYEYITRFAIFHYFSDFY